MNAVEHAILREHYKLRKLVKIWRAIARRHAETLDWVVTCHNARERALFADIDNDETDP